MMLQLLKSQAPYHLFSFNYQSWFNTSIYKAVHPAELISPQNYYSVNCEKLVFWLTLFNSATNIICC